MELSNQELGSRIRAARVRANVSQEDLGRAIGVDRTAMNRIEGGSRKVSALELADIANVIGIRMASLFQTAIPEIVSHRSTDGDTVTDSRIDALLATIADDVEMVRGLRPDDFPDAHLEVAAPASNADSESLADRARAWLGLDPGQPAIELMEAAARVGLLSFARDIGPDSADAGMVLLRSGGVAVVNSHMQVGRRRLALAHELGHFLIADDYTIDWGLDSARKTGKPLEARIDRFARAVLLPSDAVRVLWSALAGERGDRAAAVVIAHRFRVDMATLATRLIEIDCIDAPRAESVRRIRTTRQDLLELDLYVPIEELAGEAVPRAYERAVLRLVRDEKLSRERAVDLLHGTITADDLPEPRSRRADEMWDFLS